MQSTCIPSLQSGKGSVSPRPQSRRAAPSGREGWRRRRTTAVCWAVKRPRARSCTGPRPAPCQHTHAPDPGGISTAASMAALHFGARGVRRCIVARLRPECDPRSVHAAVAVAAEEAVRGTETVGSGRCGPGCGKDDLLFQRPLALQCALLRNRTLPLSLPPANDELSGTPMDCSDGLFRWTQNCSGEGPTQRRIRYR